jgi:hypothetical protein
MKYCEHCERLPFDWNKCLANPDSTLDKWKDQMVKEAGNWFILNTSRGQFRAKNLRFAVLQARTYEP